MSDDSLLTIVRFGYPLEEFRHTALDDPFLQLLKGALSKCPAALRHDTVPLKLFECVAQLLGVKVSGKPLSIESFWATSIAYVGAVNSSRFIDAPFSWRYRFTTVFLHVLEFLRGEGLYVPPLVFTAQSGARDPSLEPFVDHFEGLQLDKESVWLWHGWMSRNSEGHPTYFPLNGVYERFGRDFTHQLYQALDTYFSKGKAKHIPLVRPIAEALSTIPDVCPDKLQDPSYIDEFWSAFAEYYVTTRHKKGNQLTTITSAWNSTANRIIRDCLEPSGLFAKSMSGLPYLPNRPKSGSETRIKNTAEGTIVKATLLTDIPISETDHEAFQKLFVDIRNDVVLIEKWAEGEFNAITAAATNRVKLAEEGTPRIIRSKGWNLVGQRELTSASNPAVLKNAAATFELHGYKTMEDCDIGILYPKPIPDIALKLGMPSSGALIYHLALLVIDHPAMTAAYFEKLDLFDKSGIRTGYVTTDAGKYLCGKKDRAGRVQNFLLTERGVKVVDSIILLTQPLRDYLKAKGDDNWRSLLLHSGKSFGYPQRVNNISGWTCSEGLQTWFSRTMQESTGLSPEMADDLIRRFTLSTLRSSMGVLVYLDTGSLEAMAKALGHKDCDPRLLSHYLPAPILRFFQERWIRVFQTGMIVYAMKDSKLLLEASGLQTVHQLNEFMEKHAFKALPESKPSEEQLTGKTYVSVDEDLLRILLKIQSDVSNSDSGVSPQAEFWAAFTKKLVAYIDNQANGREELQEALAQARLSPTDIPFEKLIRS